MCRWFENLVPEEAGGVAAPRGPWTIGRLVREDKEGLRILARCLVAYACISICKPASGDQGAFVSEWSWVLYALGFSVAAFLLWLFASTSPGVGLNSLVKFVFPILALGVLLGSHGSQPAVAAGVLLLSSCHASFELANRGVVVALMRSAPDRCRLYGMAGMFVIGSGSLMGVLLYAVIGKVWPQTVAVASLAVVVLLLVLFFVDPSRGAFPAASAGCGVEAALEVRREAFAARHGLTKRETEVLGYILDGRSHPFIRDALGISKGTVDTHVRHIYQKCGVSSRQELISLTMDELDR